MSINVGQVSHFLSDGSRFYAYSGIVQGDVSVPATITLIDIPNTGLKDSFVKIIPSYGKLISGNSGSVLGISILIDGIEVANSQQYYQQSADASRATIFELFIPRGSKLEIISLNTANNNTQNRGCTMLGWCL